jgi:O-antigen ligase
MNESSTAHRVARPHFPRAIDWLAIGVAISLPWSTSATGILIALWIIASVPSLDLADLRRVISTPAGGLPLLLWALGVLGMLWADVPWADRLRDVSSFHRLLVIPLLLSHYRRSDNGWRIVTGYLASCTALLGLSLATKLWPDIWRPDNPGVPVHDQIAQSAEFVMCGFGLSYLAVDAMRAQKTGQAAALVVLVLAFFLNLVFVATSRTELVVIAVVMVLAGVRWRGLRGAVLGAAAFVALAILAWNTSAYLRDRIEHGIWEVQEYRAKGSPTSIGLRLEWWRDSVALAAQAPLLGHGTGAIKSLIPDRVSEGKTIRGINPHNQTITIALQLGLVGSAILFAMWLSHALLFRGAGPYAWIGLLIVVQNVVGSLFNSHLFDFVQGWTYIWGVGVVGGIVLRARSSGERGPQPTENESGAESLVPTPEPSGR